MNNEKSRKISGVLAGILAAFMVAAVLAGCNGGGDTGGDTTVETTPEMTAEQTLPYDPNRYTGAFSEVNGAFGGIDVGGCDICILRFRVVVIGQKNCVSHLMWHLYYKSE